MFSDLIDFEPDVLEPAAAAFVPLEKATPDKVLSAQAATVEWLNEMGVPSDEAIDKKQQTTAAREAFAAISYGKDDAQKRAALMTMKVPEAVQHLTGMLVAYDWDFVQQAKELRGYTVAGILKETTHTDARIRLKALQMMERLGCPKATGSGVCCVGDAGIATLGTRALPFAYGLNLQSGTTVSVSVSLERYSKTAA